jgi:hypothetical protein
MASPSDADEAALARADSHVLNLARTSMSIAKVRIETSGGDCVNLVHAIPSGYAGIGIKGCDRGSVADY